MLKNDTPFPRKTVFFFLHNVELNYMMRPSTDSLGVVHYTTTRRRKQMDNQPVATTNAVLTNNYKESQHASKSFFHVITE